MFEYEKDIPLHDVPYSEPVQWELPDEGIEDLSGDIPMYLYGEDIPWE